MKNKENTILITISIIAIIIATMLSNNQTYTKKQCEQENRLSHPNHIKATCENLPKGEK